MSPRPILKRSPSTGTPNAHAVHFPPSPSLTTHTFSVYSSTAYDRSPIVVSPNSCALPARGCPGRTYTLDEPSLPKRSYSYGGRDPHPRALAFNSSFQEEPDRTSTCAYSQLPPLIPDLSSESEESDSFSSPPLESSYSAPHDRFSAYTPLDMYGSDSMTPTALSFLPHSPSPSRSSYGYGSSPLDDPRSVKPKRRRERKHDSSRSPDRIPNEMGGTPEIPTPTKSSKSRTSILNRPFSTECNHSSFRIEDDGCLGGF